ncbi:hypothetical protein ABC795_17665 [Blastococcus sp. HT6-30]|uniref:LGFP repeat-containing protein n=1 Tax=Blastococcus sp. HT6-30 TaxID=3144843 RepID=UPI003218F687
MAERAVAGSSARVSFSGRRGCGRPVPSEAGAGSDRPCADFSRPGGASIYWTADTGAHEIYGAIRTRWADSGWERGPLGYPTSGVETSRVAAGSTSRAGASRWTAPPARRRSCWTERGGGAHVTGRSGGIAR